MSESPHSEFAAAAAPLWGYDAGELRHVADRGNSVWFVGEKPSPPVLRLTDPDHRTYDECLAELEYVRYLDDCGVAVAAPVPSRAGSLVESIELRGERRSVSVFRHADGEAVERDSPSWNEPLFREWGRALGRIHAASESFDPPGPCRRWHWSDEYWVADAMEFLPRDDVDSIAEFESVMAHLSEIEEARGRFGMIHADFAPANFRYRPGTGITAFDFGNCCYHWYAADVAISFSTLLDRPKAEQERLRAWILGGYREIRPFEASEVSLLPWLIRFRIVYVYLSRLWYFGDRPTPEQRQILDRLRRRVHAAGAL